jgi:hypothetical protein
VTSHVNLNTSRLWWIMGFSCNKSSCEERTQHDFLRAFGDILLCLCKQIAERPVILSEHIFCFPKNQNVD